MTCLPTLWATEGDWIVSWLYQTLIMGITTKPKRWYARVIEIPQRKSKALCKANYHFIYYIGKVGCRCQVRHFRPSSVKIKLSMRSCYKTIRNGIYTILKETEIVNFHITFRLLDSQWKLLAVSERISGVEKFLSHFSRSKRNFLHLCMKN